MLRWRRVPRRAPLAAPWALAALRAAALALLAVPLAGCSQHYLVQSTFIEESRAPADPEITRTPLYERVRGDLEVVALRPPDACEDDGAADSGGGAVLRGEVLRTRCGVELAELEKALARGGFQVVSWAAIQDRVAQAGEPPLHAARTLGVDALIQINALERAVLALSHDARWERRFYHASSDGYPGDPARVPRARGRLLERLVEHEETRLLPGERLSATIDANAVWVANGVSFWFYRWTLIERPPTDPVAEVHAVCDGELCARVQRVVMAPSGPVDGGVAAVSLPGPAADLQQAVYHKLLRALTADLVASFAGER